MPRLLSAMVVGRLPNGMRPLGIVLLVHQQQGSYAVAGAALAALMIGTTASAPFRGRAVDRWGQSRVLPALALFQTGALAGFVAAALTHRGAPAMYVFAAMTGATSSTLGGSMRALWPVVVDSAENLPAAYALQALVEDLISVAGPLAASLLLTVASPAWVLVISGVAGSVGTTAFVTAPASRSTGRRTGSSMSLSGALSTPGMRVLVCMLTSTGAVIGVLNVAIPALAEDRASTGGVLLAIMSAGSMLSGLYYGARAWKTGPSRRYVWLAAIFAAMVAPLPAAASVIQLGGLLVLVGLAYAPSMISAYLLLDDLAPAEALTEAYTWLISANAGGLALGSALAGLSMQRAGIHWTLALADVSATIGLVVGIVYRDRLEPLREGCTGLPRRPVNIRRSGSSATPRCACGKPCSRRIGGPAPPMRTK
ncbi:MFS transporter [Actinoplanes sp. NPDC051343]|uniref:MFS transporter n=1 Tax=Actinoplanes sp. NPDC051343 TaxID=3363906 RepID=UPI0037B318E2